MRSARLASICLGFALLATHVAADTGTTEYPWLDGLSLVVLDTQDTGSLHAAHALIRDAGGTVAILSPPSLLFAWLPPAKTAVLSDRHPIRAIYQNEVTAADLRLEDAQSRAMLRYWNALVRGEIRPQTELAQPQAWQPGSGDARDPEAIEPWAYVQNLQDNGFDPAQLAQRGLLAGKAGPGATVQGNSDRMTGTVTVTLLFVESNGTGSDPNTYTWTDADQQSYINGVNTGLAWWSAEARDYNNCWVAFFVRYVPPTDSRCQQWREMVTHPSADVPAMASDVMANFGFAGGSHITRVTAFNTAQRATYGTTWAYTGFVAYNPLPAPGQLTDGASAFAYLLGPYSFLLYRSYGWAPEQVFTHESGHIFGACDEYADGCTCGAICIDEPNGNCESCGGGASCMMRLNTFTLCTYTDNQLGWHDATPCAPPALTPPTATALAPASGFLGTTVPLTITGQNLLYGAFATLGEGVSVVSSTVTTSAGTDTLHLTVHIDDNAVLGSRNVIVSNRDLQSSTLASAYQVLGTPRHYYAPSGGNIYPYHTPATASTSLEDAIAAAAPGDTVLVGSGPLSIGFGLNKGVLLSGAWNPGFTTRNLATGKTVVDLTGNLFIAVSGGGTGGLDGFELRNGQGAAWSVPFAGFYGGAVSIVSSNGLIANCDIHSNEAIVGAGFGGGGGIFATNSTVTLIGNTITGNTATRGGGIYLHGTSGSVIGNTIANNAVTAGTQTPRGAGIVIDGCTNLTLTNNNLNANTGAENGGGLYIVNSTNINVQGGSIEHHAVTNSGGGARIDGGQAMFTSVVFERNSSGFSEGGLAATGGAALQLDECSFLWNRALLFGGVHATGPTASVRHSLFVGNSSFANGGLALDNVASGVVLGNTFDRNAANSGGGSLALNTAPIQVSNNILVNTTGTAVACSGTLPTLLAYNLAWNSSIGNYSGCSPGAGSITGDPRFADTTQVDYRLALHSAAIDAGRIDGGFLDPDGSRGDLGRYGAHAFTMAQPVYPKNLSAQTTIGGNVVLRWSANPEMDVESYAVYADIVSGFKPAPGNFVTLVASPDTTVNLGPTTDLPYYTIAAIDASGYASGYAVQAFLPTTTDAPAPPVAWRFQLHSSTPNPFNPVTTIRFELDRAGPARVEIFDLAGRLVRTLTQGQREAGLFGIVWDGTDGRGRRVPSGTYLMRLESTGRTATQKLTVLK